MRKKKIYVLMLVMSTVILNICVSASGNTDIATLEYLETKIVTVKGDLSLKFNSSDTGNADVILLWKVFSSDNNMTVLSFTSLPVDVDPSFVNNTKEYVFRDNNSGGYYSVFVDYSVIDVPQSEEEILLEIISEMEAQIEELNLEIELLKSQIITINNTRIELEKLLNSWKTKSNEWETKFIHEKEITNPLRDDIKNLTTDIETMENVTIWMDFNISILKQEKISLENSIADLRDVWSMGFSYHGDDFFNFGGAWALIIGLFIAGALSYTLFVKLKGKSVKSKIKGNAITDVEKPRSHSLLRSLFSMDHGSNKRLEVAEGKPLSFGTNSLEPDKLHETLGVTVEKEGSKTIGDLKEPITIMEKPEINWKLVENDENFKSWSYNGGKPIQAKKNNGVWEIYIDGVKQTDTFGTPLDVFNNIRKYQRDYNFVEISAKIDQVI